LKLAAPENPIGWHTHIRHGVECDGPGDCALGGANLHNSAHASQRAGQMRENEEARQKPSFPFAHPTHRSHCRWMAVEVFRQQLADFFKHTIILWLGLAPARLATRLDFRRGNFIAIPGVVAFCPPLPENGCAQYSSGQRGDKDGDLRGCEIRRRRKRLTCDE